MSMRRLRQALTVVTAATMSVHESGHAQAVRGTLRDSLSERAIQGAVVVLLDSVANRVDRVISNADGNFSLRTQEPGWYRLEVLRLGFRPYLSASFQVDRGMELERVLLVNSQRIVLDTVRVVGRTLCDSREYSQNSAPFTVWEQVRTALSAVEITRRFRSINAAVLAYDRILEPDGVSVRSQTFTMVSGLASGPWRAASPDLLRDRGYVVEEADGSSIYYAPDLVNLLSNQFVEDHCFRLTETADTTALQLAFTPNRDRRDVSDIRGHIRVDRASFELKSMDFQYTGLPSEITDAGAGGTMTFARARHGSWVIADWEIRMPVVTRQYEQTLAAGRTRSELRSRLREVRVAGGQLVTLRRGQDTLWSRPPMRFAIRVIDSLSERPMPTALVRVHGTGSEGWSDADGVVTLSGMLPGRYRVEVVTPALDSLNARHVDYLTFADASKALELAVPPVPQVAARICQFAAAQVATGIIVGSVKAVGGRPLPAARVTAEWLEDVDRLVDTVRVTGKRARWVESTTDNAGRYRLCGVPRETRLTLRADSGRWAATPLSITVQPNELATRMELLLHELHEARATLTGTVSSDVNGAPVPDVQVSVPAAGRSTFTDERGRFRLSELPPGAHNVSLRRIGHTPIDTSMRLDAGQIAARNFMLSRVVLMDSVVITASAVGREFEEHRRLGLGHFLTRAELARMEGRKMADILAELPGVKVIRGRAHGAYAATNRGVRTLGGCTDTATVMFQGTTPQSGDLCACFAQVYVDGIAVFSGKSGEIPDLNRLVPAQIEAVEFYAGPAQTPARYSNLNAHCGVLAIHTRKTTSDK